MNARNKVVISRIAGNHGQKKTRTRATHSKTRTGCLVCRSKRIKCDESRPVCTRCKRNQLPCHYSQPVHNALSILLDRKELRSFQFYREQTAHDLGGHFDKDFWTSVVLRLSYTNDTLQHFLVALGSLDESFHLRKSSPEQAPRATSLYAFSLEQYSTAINSILKDHQLQSMPALVLTSCIACILYEMWLGAHDTAKQHALAACRLQWQLGYSTLADEQRQIVDGYLKPMVARNSCQLSVGVRYSDIIPQQQPMAHNRLGSSSSGSFESLADAKLEFEAVSTTLINQTSTVIQIFKGLELGIKLKKLVSCLDRWHEAFSTLPRQLEFGRKRAYDLLRMKYHAHRIAISCAPYADETIYDKHIDDFKAVVDLCAAFLRPFNSASRSGVIRTHDLGTCMALNLVGCSCRDPFIRREAIRLLYRNPRLEGIWSSYGGGYYAEMVLMLEEEGLTEVRTVRDIPAGRRVRIEEVRYDPGCLATRADNEPNVFDPPSLTPLYTRPNSRNPSSVYQITTPLKRYHIASGFGDKSDSWWPTGPAWDNSILNSEVDEQTKHHDGPFLGHVPWSVIYHRVVERQCNMTHLSLDI